MRNEEAAKLEVGGTIEFGDTLSEIMSVKDNKVSLKTTPIRPTSESRISFTEVYIQALEKMVRDMGAVYRPPEPSFENDFLAQAILADTEHLSRADQDLEDIRKGLNALCRVAGEASKASGFWDGDFGPIEQAAATMLMVTELSEAVEEIRKGSPASEKIKGEKERDVEYADTTIRIGDFCSRADIALGDVVVKKILFNRSRPPKHGKLF